MPMPCTDRSWFYWVPVGGPEAPDLPSFRGRHREKYVFGSEIMTDENNSACRDRREPLVVHDQRTGGYTECF